MLLLAVRQTSKDFRRRRRVSRANRKVRDARENATRRALERLWGAIGAKVMRRVRKIGKTGFTVDEIFRPSEYAAAFNTIFIPQFTRTLFTGIRFEAEYIESQGGVNQFSAIVEQVERTEIVLPPGFDVKLSPTMQRRIADILSKRQVGVWSKVGATTRSELEKIILKGQVDGLTFAEMERQIAAKLGSLKNVQPKAIARTETTLGMNHGGQIERLELQIPFKEWLSVIDALNRGMDPKSSFDHISPDGQIVKNEDVFIVSGEQLMYPADSSRGASAGNIVNCRCASVASLRGP